MRGGKEGTDEGETACREERRRDRQKKREMKENPSEQRKQECLPRKPQTLRNEGKKIPNFS